MRHKTAAIALLLALGLGAGCATSNGSSKAEPKQGAPVTVARSYDDSYAHKTDYIDKMKKELAGLGDQMDRLSAKVDRSVGVVKADARTKLDALRGEWTKVKKELEKAESATESTWEDVKNAFKKSYGEMEQSYDKTRQWMSDKLAP